MEIGRLIPTLTAAGAMHMAIDTEMLAAIARPPHVPTLRFYQWQPLAISLGYHQREVPAHWHTLRWQGQAIDLVRRPTGGRAVLHGGDFTYAIALPMRGGLALDDYRLICDALIAAWQQLGVRLHYGAGGSSYRHQSGCFALATPADLVTPEGYKLIGSAQLRRDRLLLQQGTMRLWPNRDLESALFGSTMNRFPRPTSLPLTPDADWLRQVEAACITALSHALERVFVPTPLSTTEQQVAQTQAPTFRVSPPEAAESGNGLP